MVTFDVAIEDSNGRHVKTFYGVVAQTRREAINKAKSSLVFTASKPVLDECETKSVKESR